MKPQMAGAENGSGKGNPSLFLPDGTPFLLESTQGNGTKRLTPEAGSRPADRQVGFAELEDGSLLETVENPSNPTRTLLARWKNGLVTYETSVRSSHETLVPLRRDGPVLRRITLPRGVKSYGSTSDLAKRVEEFLARLVKLRDEVVPLAISFVLSTWVSDRLPVSPYLLILAPVDFQRMACLKALALVCRHPILTGDFSVAGLYRACESFSATLLIDEPAGPGSRNRHHLLRLGTEPAFVGLRQNGSFSACGSKVISAPTLPEDTGLRAKCLNISMGPRNLAGVARTTDPEILELADDLQQQLLMFRFQTHSEVRPVAIRGAEWMRAEAQELLSCLAAPFADDAAYCNSLLEGVRFSEGLFEPLNIYQQAVLSALFFFTHASPDVTVKEIGQMANLGLQQMEEKLRMTDRKVGAVLDTLGYFPRDRDSSGCRVTLDKSTCEAIHQLVRTYGRFELDTDAYQMPKLLCEWCRKLALISSEQATIDRFRIKEQEDRLRPWKQGIERVWAELGIDEPDAPTGTPEHIASPRESPKREDG